MARKVGGRGKVFDKRDVSQVRRNIIVTRGNRQLAEPKVVLLCEDTKSAYYYYKYFIRQHSLNVELQPQVKSSDNKSDYAEGLDLIFRRASIFHQKNDAQFIMLAFDLDVYYRKNDPHIKNKETYEKFLEENKGHDRFVYLSTFPCFEYWLYLHYQQSDKYFDSYAALLPELNKVLKKNQFKTLANTVCIGYEKSGKFWVKRTKSGEQILASNFPTENLVRAIRYSKNHKLEIGVNSHSDIWKFFHHFKAMMPEIQSAFEEKHYHPTNSYY